MSHNASMTPVLRGSGVLCYVETRVLTRVGVTDIDVVMSCEAVSGTRAWTCPGPCIGLSGSRSNQT
jgi:hypothetical protein